MLCCYAIMLQKICMVNGDVLNFSCHIENSDIFPLALNPIVTHLEAIPDGTNIYNSAYEGHRLIFLIRLLWVESNWVHSARRPLIGLLKPNPSDYDNGEFGGMKICRGNRSTWRKPAPAPLCPPQTPLDQTRDQTRTAAVGSQRLTAWAMARPLSERNCWIICNLTDLARGFFESSYSAFEYITIY
jgi:hypothetical protein